MKKLRTVLSVFLVIAMCLAFVPVTTHAATISMSDTEIQQRIDDLNNKLGGKYFTVNQQPCNQTFVTGHACSNCQASKVLATTWFKNIFGSVSTSYFPTHYTWGSYNNQDGYSCAGFANFAAWYIFSRGKAEKVSTYNAGNYTFNSSATAQMRKGDILRLATSQSKFGDHTVIYISTDSTGINVIDCNGVSGANLQCRVIKHHIGYSDCYKYVTISRVEHDSNSAPTPVNLGDDFYAYIVKKNVWKHITVNKRNVEIAEANDNYNPAQIWQFIRQSDGSYKIKNMWWEGQDDVSWTMEAYNAGTTNGTNVDVWKENNSLNARWFIYDKGDDKKILVPANSSLTLDAKDGQSAGGTNIQLYEQNSSDAQLYAIYKLSSDHRSYKKPGKPTAPKYTGPASGTTGETMTLSWDASKKVNDFDKRSYTLKVTDASGNVVVNKSGLIATTYKFTPSKAGNYTVHITAVNDYYKEHTSAATKATIRVADKAIAVSSITLDRRTLALTEGLSMKLNATVLPENAADKTVTWSSSNNSVATASTNGTVTGKKAGTAIITAKSGGKTATCEVTVLNNNIPVDRVEISNATMNLKKGQTGNLTVSVIPDIATNKAVTWSSSDPSVATVDNNGKVTAVKEGIAVITVTAGGKSDSCDVTVQESSSGNVPVTSVTLDKISLVMKEGDKEKLTPTVLPANATQKNVSWSSSDTSVASVDGSGNVTARKAGTATITVHADGKTATCQVAVKKEGAATVSIDSIEVSKTTLTMTEGETTSIAVTVKPVEAAENNVQATNSNGNVIHISAGAGSSTPNVYNVKIEAKQAGTATITFTGGGKTAECKVTVKEKSGTQPVEETEQHGVNCASAKYTDVNRSESNWTHLPIDYVLEKGYMAGISANRFDPNGTVTRAQIVQILYAKEGKPATSGARIFSDVPGGQWYTNAIEWASRNKVVAGYTDGTFKPNQAITREQMVTILRAYAGYKGLNTAANGDVNSFSDSGKISNYAQQAMKWAVGNKLIGGTGKGIEPQGTATRAQIAVILKAYDINFG